MGDRSRAGETAWDLRPRSRRMCGRYSPLGFSRDGSFYYRTDEPHHTDVYTAQIDLDALADSSNPKSLDKLSRLSSNPAYSPDGKRLAYFSRRGSPFAGTAGGYLTIVIRSIETGRRSARYRPH